MQMADALIEQGLEGARSAEANDRHYRHVEQLCMEVFRP